MGQGTNNIYTSTDNGITWKAVQNQPFGTGGGNSVTTDGTNWVAVGQGRDSSGKLNGDNIWYTFQAPNPPKPKTQTIIDYTKFTLPLCPSQIQLDDVQGYTMTASIVPFDATLYYTLYVDGVPKLYDITTSPFEYTFQFPGTYNVYITCSSKPTANVYPTTLPSKIVQVTVIPRMV